MYVETKSISEESDIIEALSLINPTQLLFFKDLIYGKSNSVSDGQFIKLLQSRLFIEEKVCPHCSGTYIVKNGKNHLKRQRYKCKNCGKIFCDFTNTAMSYSKKPVQQWLKYIECMCKGLSIRKTAGVVKIHRNTSFQWRHKILNAIKLKLPEDLTGIIEIDEFYVNESFKGNHSKDPNFSMGRKPIKRKQYGFNNLKLPKICVLCCKDRTENMFSKVASKGKATFKDIDLLLNDKISNDAILCTKNSIAYTSFAAKKKLKLYRITWSEEIKEEIYHIKNVRSFEEKLKKFLRDFKGVATKYLNFYILWFKWMELNVGKLPIYRVMDLALLLTSSREKLRICDFKFVKSLI